MNDFKNVVESMLSAIFGSSMSDTLSTDLTINTDFTTGAWSTVSNIYHNVLCPIGIGIIALFFCYALIERITAERITMEAVIKLCLKLAVYVLLLDLMPDLIHTFVKIGNAVMNKVTVGSPETNEIAHNIMLKLGIPERGDGFFKKAQSLFDCLPYYMFLALPWLVSMVCDLLVKVIAFTRTIEIYVRGCFLPVAMGDSFNGLSSGAVRYVKGFAAVCLQGAVILVIVVVCTAIYGAYINVNLEGGASITADHLWQLALLPTVFKVAETGLIAKSLQLSKEICGC